MDELGNGLSPRFAAAAIDGLAESMSIKLGDGVESVRDACFEQGEGIAKTDIAMLTEDSLKNVIPHVLQDLPRHCQADDLCKIAVDMRRQDFGICGGIGWEVLCSEFESLAQVIAALWSKCHKIPMKAGAIS